jgi:multiple sugar transport system substrate-binding protein
MPTIKDIAHYAGVSHGTVSNVLNKRGNVSVEKINLVLNAVEDLVYKVNTQAKQLREGKTNQVAVIIPRLEIKRYVDLYIGINSVLSNEGYEVTIHCSNDSSTQELKLFNSISASNPSAIVVVSVSPLIKYPENDDVAVYFVLRKVFHAPKNSVFIGFDYYKIGEELAKKAISEGNNNFACFCGMTTNQSDNLFYKGCSDQLERDGFKCDGIFSENATTYQRAFKIVNNTNQYDAIIAYGNERADSLCAAIDMKNIAKKPSIYCATNKEFTNTSFYQKYNLNYKFCGSIVAKKINNKNKKDQIIPCDGFYNPITINKTKEFKQINFLALQSPTSEALSYIVPKFTKETGIKVKIIKYPYQELYNKVRNAHNTKAYDIIRIDMAWLSKLGCEIFKPLDLNKYPYKNICDSFIKTLPANYFYSNGISCALPFDTSTQLLYYRKDLFEDALIKRVFFEKTKRKLEVPKTYEEFDFISKFFTRKINPDSPTQYGTSMIKGSSVAIACELLPRIKAKGLSIFDKNDKVTVNTKEIKETVREYLELANYTSEGQYSWWENTIEEFAKEKIAMTIVFGNHASRLVQSQKTAIINKIGFAEIPGSKPLLGGGVLGISKNTEKLEEIEIFLRWLYSRNTTDFVNYLGGYISSIRLTQNIDAISLYPWTTCFKESFNKGWRNPITRNPKFDEFEFEQILGTTLSSIIAGLLDVDEGLDEVQKEFDVRFN